MPTDARVTAKNVKLVALGVKVQANTALRAVGNPESTWSAQKSTNVDPVLNNRDVPGNLVTYAELPSLTALATLGYDVQQYLNNVNVVDSDATRNALSAGAVAPLPTVASATPATAAATGGASIALVGANFTPDMTVKFGGVTATVAYVDPTHATATVPVLTAGSRTIVVSTAAGAQAAPTAFTAT